MKKSESAHYEGNAEIQLLNSFAQGARRLVEVSDATVYYGLFNLSAVSGQPTTRG